MAVEIELQPKMPKCWSLASKPHKFCPGCGHGMVLKAIGQAIDELGIQDRVVFGCDIGCSLLSWDFFDVDTVQTHHGRTTPVLVGVKRANPDLIVIAYMGDGGGYAIGSQHLVNAANRNDRITAVLCCNTNYAMTGGQMAPTSMPGQKTETTPYGRDVNEQGYPMLGPEMVAAITHEGAYVARGTVSKLRTLKGYIKKALENQIAGRGFSFVEALSTCPTNWRTNAQQTWAFLEEDMQGYFPVGELKVPAEAAGGAPEGKEE
jgi:2-oxoglutarate ferredoxin oxidoreductase subunit beta